MHVTCRSLLSSQPPPTHTPQPPTLHVHSICGGGGEEEVDGRGSAVHTGAVVLSVWHIKLYKGNHLCATPYYWTAWRQLMRAKAKGIYPPLCCETDTGRERKPGVFRESLFSGKKKGGTTKGTCVCLCVCVFLTPASSISLFIYFFTRKRCTWATVTAWGDDSAKHTSFYAR